MSNVHNPQKLVSRDFKWFHSMSLHQYIRVWHQSDLRQRSIHCSLELQPPGEKSGQPTGPLQSGTCENLLHVILLCICITNEKKTETIWGDTEHKISQTDLDKLVYFRLIHGVWKPRFLNTCSCIQTSWIISNTYKIVFFLILIFSYMQKTNQDEIFLWVSWNAFKMTLFRKICQ